MNWPARCKIHEVSKSGVVLIEDGRFVATDGHMMVVVPFSGAGPSGKVVASKALAHAAKGRAKTRPTAHATWNDDELVMQAGDRSVLSAPLGSGEEHPRPSDVEEPGSYLTVRFSAEQLAKAAAALGADVVEIRIARDEFVVHRPLVIRPRDGGRDGEFPIDGAYAVLGVHT